MDRKRPSRPAPRGDDVALICGASRDGSDLHIVRRRNNRLEAGVARALREGQPISGELVRLRPRREFPLLCDVDVELTVKPPSTSDDAAAEAAPSSATAVPSPSAVRSGPPRVASASYRRNWDAIWSRPSSKRLVN